MINSTFFLFDTQTKPFCAQPINLSIFVELRGLALVNWPVKFVVVTEALDQKMNVKQAIINSHYCTVHRNTW